MLDFFMKISKTAKYDSVNSFLKYVIVFIAILFPLNCVLKD